MKFINKHKNAVYGVIAAFIVIGYILFFLSPKFIYTSVEDLLYTPLNTKISISGGSIEIEDWKYSEKQSKMEVILSLNSGNNDVSNKYTFKTVSRNKDKTYTKVNNKIEYQSASFVSLSIENIPKDFGEIGISIESVNKHNDEEVNDTVSIYTNYSKVSKIDKIETLSIVNIYIDKINDEISEYEEEITSLNDEIDGNKITQQDILERVAELKESEKYMTADNVEKVESQIKSLKNQYDTLTSKNESNQKKIDDFEEIIEENKSKLTELKTMIKKKGT